MTGDRSVILTCSAFPTATPDCVNKLKCQSEKSQGPNLRICPQPSGAKKGCKRPTKQAIRVQGDDLHLFSYEDIHVLLKPEGNQEAPNGLRSLFQQRSNERLENTEKHHKESRIRHPTKPIGKARSLAAPSAKLSARRQTITRFSEGHLRLQIRI